MVSIHSMLVIFNGLLYNENLEGLGLSMLHITEAYFIFLFITLYEVEKQVH
jgi:hypothetical protein